MSNLMQIEEREVPMRTVRVAATCPSCREGDLEFNPETPVIMSQPPQFWHLCTKCGFEAAIAGIRYPYIDARDVN